MTLRTMIPNGNALLMNMPLKLRGNDYFRPQNSPHRLRDFLTLSLALLTAGCGDRGYTFSTKATYDIPALGFRADIIAQGKVPPGADLADNGTSRIILTRLGNPDAPVATLYTSNPVVSVPSGQTITYAIGTSAPMTLPWGSIESEASLRKILTTSGFTNDVPAAFSEALYALSGPALGPKSTAVATSTQVIAVKVIPTFQR